MSPRCAALRHDTARSNRCRTCWPAHLEVNVSVDAALLRAIAIESLGLTLSESEAAALVQPYVGLQRMIAVMDEVPLPFSQDPFVSPATGDHWLEAWPDK